MQNTMVPLMREDHDLFQSHSMPSLSLSDSQRSYFNVEDRVKRTSDVKKNKSAGGKRRKRVSFSEYSMLHLIPSMNSYTKEELDAMYLTEEDNRRIEKENSKTIDEIRNGKLPDTDSECFRGLECRGISHLSNQKRSMRQITMDLIISEQEQGDELCPDWIENVYCTITQDSVSQANEMASWDAQSVLKDITVA